MKRGFTLLEVLVATVIMGMAVTALIIGLSQSVKNASRLTEYDRAAMLARTKMNELLLEPNLPLQGEVEGSFDRNDGWRAVSRPFEVPPNAGPGSLILQEIALEVWWQPAGGTPPHHFAGRLPANTNPGASNAMRTSTAQPASR